MPRSSTNVLGRELAVVRRLRADVAAAPRARPSPAARASSAPRSRNTSTRSSKSLRGLGGEAEAEAEEIDSDGLKTQDDALRFLYEIESAPSPPTSMASPTSPTTWPRTLLRLDRRQPGPAPGPAAAGRSAPAAAESVPEAVRGRHDARAPSAMIAAMTGPLYAIGRFCSRHHYPIDRRSGSSLAVGARPRSARPAASKTNENLTLPGTGSTDRDRTARRQPARTGLRQQPAGVRSARSGKLTDPQYSAAVAETAKHLEANCSDVNSAISPLSPQGAELPQQRPADRLHPGRARRRSGRNRPKKRRSGSSTPPGPAEAAGLETSVGSYVGQQLSKPVDRDQRGDRARRGGDHPALRLRHGDGDDAADRLGGDRPRLRALDHPPARARDRRCRASPRPWRR